MIVAYIISPFNDGTRMLGDSTFRPPAAAGFHDWRYGKDGVAHPATCPTCGRKTDANYINPRFKAKRRTWDISQTSDGYVIASARFRQFCEKQDYQGVAFDTLPNDQEFFILRLSNLVPFDAERRETRFEDPCPKCKAFYSVVGATPAFLRGITDPIKEGLFRSDLEFASGPEQHPLIFVGTETAEKLKEQRFQKYDLKAVNS